MKRGRVLHRGQVLTVTPAAPDQIGDERVRLPDGQVVAGHALDWLPPMDFGTVFALGLNYAAHAREIAQQAASAAPLVFLKGPNTMTGHRQRTRRPVGVRHMHMECELGVVIGRRSQRLRREDALAAVGGYCTVNDYAIRDYLENVYRPNLRVKNRDGCTPVGPWVVDAGDVADPMNLQVRSWVNGVLKQDGHTGDMVHDVAGLIAYLSGFMTLEAGDLILTGTPEGVADCGVGDEVVTEVQGVGRLVNTLVGDEALQPD